jgi:hypothetical protein
VRERKEGAKPVPKHGLKLKEKKRALPLRSLRFTIPGELAADLETYGKLYAEIHCQEISLPELIEAILQQFLASDHTFRRRRFGDHSAGSENGKESIHAR